MQSWVHTSPETAQAVQQAKAHLGRGGVKLVSLILVGHEHNLQGLGGGEQQGQRAHEHGLPAAL